MRTNEAMQVVQASETRGGLLLCVRTKEGVQVVGEACEVTIVCCGRASRERVVRVVVESSVAGDFCRRVDRYKKNNMHELRKLCSTTPRLRVSMIFKLF